MVKDGGQLYTLEGIAGAIIVIVTMYLVLGTTAIYTPGDTHITDMQLEQLGSDALRMMDTPNASGMQSDLVMILSDYNNRTMFSGLFRTYCNQTFNGKDNGIEFGASVFYRDDNLGNISSYPLTQSQQFSGREPAVRVTRWVQINDEPQSLPEPYDTDGIETVGVDRRKQVVLVEVLLWRG
jgi:hypothetical protein